MKRSAMLVLACLAGCATSGKFQANMDSMMGGDIGPVVSWLGPPANVFQVNASDKVYTFQSGGGQLVLPGQTYNTAVTSRTTGYVNSTPYTANTTTYVPQQGPATVIPLSCTVNVTTHNDVVNRWQANGNHCISK
jgi:hypothetical protein